MAIRAAVVQMMRDHTVIAADRALHAAKHRGRNRVAGSVTADA